MTGAEPAILAILAATVSIPFAIGYWVGRKSGASQAFERLVQGAARILKGSDGKLPEAVSGGMWVRTTSREWDQYLLILEENGEILANQCWKKGLNDQDLTDHLTPGHIRVELPRRDFQIICFCADLGFNYRIPLKSRLPFDNKSTAEEAHRAIESLEWQVPYFDPAQDWRNSGFYRFTEICDRWPNPPNSATKSQIKNTA